MIEQEGFAVQESPDQVLGADGTRIGRSGELRHGTLQPGQLSVLRTEKLVQLGLLRGGPLARLDGDDLGNRFRRPVEGNRWLGRGSRQAEAADVVQLTCEFLVQGESQRGAAGNN